MNRLTSLAAAASALLLISACASKEKAMAPDVLVAVRVATPPVLDGVADDPAWAAAKAITVKLADGVNFANGKGSRTAPLGCVDDQYRDHTRWDPKTAPNASRKGDPGGPENAGFGLVNGKPEFMSRDGQAANVGGKYCIVDCEQVPFDGSRFKPGDGVASYRIFPLKGDRADIRVSYSWAAGMHTSEVSLKLVTGNKFDVQFSNLGARYGFGFAAFDNAQVRHAVHFDPLYMAFAK